MSGKKKISSEGVKNCQCHLNQFKVLHNKSGNNASIPKGEIFNFILPYGGNGELVIKVSANGNTLHHTSYYKVVLDYCPPENNGFVNYCSAGNGVGKLFEFKAELAVDDSKSGGAKYSYPCSVEMIKDCHHVYVAFKREGF